MRNTPFLAAVCGMLVFGLGHNASADIAVQTDFSSQGKITFDGAGNFILGTSVFMVDYGTPGSFSTSGPFAIGTVYPIPGGQEALVTGPGETLIFGDGSGNNWVGNFSWGAIRTYPMVGSFGVDATLMFTSRSYSGGDTRLQELRDFPDTHIVAAFTISNPGEDLIYFKENKDSYTYSGHLGAESVPDAGSTAGLLGLALGGLAWLKRRAA